MDGPSRCTQNFFFSWRNRLYDGSHRLFVCTVIVLNWALLLHTCSKLIQYWSNMYLILFYVFFAFLFTWGEGVQREISWLSPRVKVAVGKTLTMPWSMEVLQRFTLRERICLSRRRRAPRLLNKTHPQRRRSRQGRGPMVVVSTALRTMPSTPLSGNSPLDEGLVSLA